MISLEMPKSLERMENNMNALANSQYGELQKFLCEGYTAGKEPVTFERYTGQENDEAKQQIVANPPDILLTN